MEPTIKDKYIILGFIGVAICLISFFITLIVSASFNQDNFVRLIVFVCSNILGWLLYLSFQTVIFDSYEIWKLKSGKKKASAGIIKAQEEQIEAERLAKQREREKAYREKRKAKKLAENGGEIVKTKICPHCQKEFVPTSNRQIFCSKDCCYQARQDKTKADREAEKGNHYYRQRVCAVCGSTYWPTHSQQKFCSEECQKQNHNEKSLEFYHKKQKEKSGCNDLLQTKELVSSTNSSEIITIPA